MKRDEILDAAAQIFSQKGYHATSMQDIAEAVHLQKASLYHHVSSKQEILEALMERALHLLIAEMTEVIHEDLPPEEKLRRAMGSYLKALTDYPDLSAILLFEMRSLEEEQRRRHIPDRDRFEGLWRKIIEEGQQAGRFNCADPALTARALLGVMNWTLTWYKADGPLSGEQIAMRYVNLFLGGLRVRAGA